MSARNLLHILTLHNSQQSINRQMVTNTTWSIHIVVYYSVVNKRWKLLGFKWVLNAMDAVSRRDGRGRFGHRHPGKGPCEDGGRGGSDVATSQGRLAAREAERGAQTDSPSGLQRGQPCPHLELRLLAFRSGRQCISVVLRPPRVWFFVLLVPGNSHAGQHSRQFTHYVHYLPPFSRMYILGGQRFLSF